MLDTNVNNTSSISMVKSKVELYDGSTLLKTCTCGDYLQDFSLTREGDTSKFFGFGVVHRLALNLIDIDRTLNINKGNTIEIALGDGTNFDYPFPTLYTVEVKREEKANDIAITAYDILQATSNYTLADLNLTAPYTLKDIVIKIAGLLGVEVAALDDSFNLTFTEGANFSEEGTETLREVLNAIAEVTQTIYYLNSNNHLVFARLDRDGEPALTIYKKDYYEFSTQTPRILSGICHTTELGDNVYSGSDTEVIQYVRNNPFWENRTDIGTLLDNALSRMAGISITQLECDWVGNYLLEIGDKIEIETEDGNFVNSYILDDVIDYAGYINEITSWEYTQDDGEKAANPSTIGEKLNQTFARVDKVNKRIELLVSDVDETKENVASLTLTTESINLKVTEHEKKIEAFEELETGQIVDRMAQIELDLEGIEATVSENNTKVENIEADNEEINKELSALKSADTTLTGKIEANTSKISGIEVELSSVKTTVSNQSSKISSLENEDLTIKGSIEANSKAIGELEVTTENISLSVSNQNSKITTLETTTTNQSNQISGLEGEINSQNETISELSGVVDTNTTNITTITKTTEEHTESISQIEIDLESINLSVSNQDSKITNLETTTTNQGTAIDGLSEEVDKNTTAIGTLTETTETHTSQISQLQVGIEGIEASVSSNTSQINTVKDSVSELETTTETHTSQIGALQIGADEISATVTNITETSRVSTENIEEQIEQLTQEVNTKVTAEELNIAVKNEVANGVNKVTTTTGFTFNEEGLTISKSGQEMKTQITEDGMTVYKDTTAVLTADNTGVDAKNLKASTYLVIGTNSRFENYGSDRTACFWIGD